MKKHAFFDDSSWSLTSSVSLVPCSVKKNDCYKLQRKTAYMVEAGAADKVSCPILNPFKYQRKISWGRNEGKKELQMLLENPQKFLTSHAKGGLHFGGLE